MGRSYTRHDEVPVYAQRDACLESNLFNRATLLLKHADDGMRLPLPGLRHLEVILQRDAWIVVDTALGDIPVIAWLDFQVDTEHPLHCPVTCCKRLFDARAGLLERRVLDVLEAQLNALRLDDVDRAPGCVLSFRGGPDYP